MSTRSSSRSKRPRRSATSVPHPEPPPAAPNPFQTLPDEILGAVFVSGCPAPPYDDGDTATSGATQKYQMLITSVCQRWRRVAHHTPRLWTSVELRRPDDKVRDAMMQEMLKFILTLSGSLDLFVTLNFTPQLLDAYHPIISPHFPRVQLLWVQIDGPVPTDALNVEKLPRLRNAFIKGRCSTPTDGDGQPSSVQHLLTSEHMHMRTLHCAVLDLKIVLSTDALSSVEELHIEHRVTDDDFIEVVNNSTKLRNLTLRTGRWLVGTQIASETLERLDVRIGRLIMPLHCFLRHTPKLRHVVTHFDEVDKLSIPPVWPPLPSMRSYKPHKHCFKPRSPLGVLKSSPHLLAIEAWDADALEMFRYLLGDVEVYPAPPAISRSSSSVSGSASATISESLQGNRSVGSTGASTHTVALPSAATSTRCPELRLIRVKLDAGLPHEMLRDLRTYSMALIRSRCSRPSPSPSPASSSTDETLEPCRSNLRVEWYVGGDTEWMPPFPECAVVHSLIRGQEILPPIEQLGLDMERELAESSL